MSDYNHFAFISEFESMLDKLGFYLKKNFDDTNKGGRFFEKNSSKNKAIGRYKYVPDYESSSGNHLIIYTFFEVRDKSTGKLLNSKKTEYFWYRPKNTNQIAKKSTYDVEKYKKLRIESEKKAIELQIELSKQAYQEYLMFKEEYLNFLAKNPLVNADRHPYIKRKNVLAGRGVIVACKYLKIPSYYNRFKTDPKIFDFQQIKKSDLVIPAIDINFNFRTYQRIDTNGGKFQRIDITTVGAFYLLGDWNEKTKIVYLVEGYATGYTLHRAMGDGVVLVCFDVNNIGVVARLISEKYPKLIFVIGTDNDRKKSTKVGLYKGFEYSYIYNMPFIFPKFEDEPEYEDLSDINDLSTILLDNEIKKMIEDQINFFFKYGKKDCIKWVAESNGLSLDDLKEYAQISREKNLFDSLFS